MLQVAHLSYHTTYPHAPFNPYQFLSPLEGTAPQQPGGGGSSLAIALYAADGVRHVHAAVIRRGPLLQVAAAAAAAAGGRHQAQSEEDVEEDDGEDNSSSSRFPSPDLTPRSTPPMSPAAQRMPAAHPGAGAWPWGHHQQQQQQRHQVPATSSSWPAQRRASASPRGSPWPQHRRRQQQQAVSAHDGGMQCSSSSLEAQYALVSCSRAAPLSRACSSGACGLGASACGALAAVSLAAAPQLLDLESCIYAALQQQGLPPAALLDYAAAPVLGCSWGDQEGLLLLAVLRLARQPGPPSPHQQRQHPQPPQHRSACVLLHAAAASGAGAVVEWLEPPYPWHHDLSAFLVQQTAFAGEWCRTDARTHAQVCVGVQRKTGWTGLEPSAGRPP